MKEWSCINSVRETEEGAVEGEFDPSLFQLAEQVYHNIFQNIIVSDISRRILHSSLPAITVCVSVKNRGRDAHWELHWFSNNLLLLPTCPAPSKPINLILNFLFSCLKTLM